MSTILEKFYIKFYKILVTVKENVFEAKLKVITNILHKNGNHIVPICQFDFTINNIKIITSPIWTSLDSQF